MFFYVFVVFYTQSLVLMLQYHISTTKHSTVPVFMLYVLLHSTVPVFILYVLLCVRCINVTKSGINNQTFYRSRV